ncbi:NAD(P)-dependent oxidoreductase [Novosphingobium album (ex Liu et al. 2023)]|uniref:NAD(P)-dependent oxidoreductase n=1 Tax=Novosphingobium album (ex Liu et al. 2023) TaxID=3031130 RepID=A0ABT5WKL3_9SPHN|nr:NAD(P)-dependent oxidoreductase [Novosphingobium album (ex Liu et al. 2023)]MDE8650584.1 NAD(P)-dependent oxidoreductase [Novosphingobium album (ex Liu et al. 2023)]
MKVALIGATGRVGSRLTTELVSRGHVVTGIVMHPPVNAPDTITIVQANAADANALAPLLVGHDAVISAARFVTSDADALIAAVTMAQVKRLLVVGGAGSLEVAPGTALLDSDGFPEAFRTEAQAGARFLQRLRSERDVDWTFLSPSAEFASGARTGHFRLGRNDLLIDANGKSHISMEDFAIAMVDELEKPSHSRQRFTVGY